MLKYKAFAKNPVFDRFTKMTDLLGFIKNNKQQQVSGLAASWLIFKTTAKMIKISKIALKNIEFFFASP